MPNVAHLYVDEGQDLLYGGTNSEQAYEGGSNDWIIIFRINMATNTMDAAQILDSNVVIKAIRQVTDAGMNMDLIVSHSGNDETVYLKVNLQGSTFTGIKIYTQIMMTTEAVFMGSQSMQLSGETIYRGYFVDSFYELQTDTDYIDLAKMSGFAQTTLGEETCMAILGTVDSTGNLQTLVSLIPSLYHETVFDWNFVDSIDYAITFT